MQVASRYLEEQTLEPGEKQAIIDSLASPHHDYFSFLVNRLTNCFANSDFFQSLGKERKKGTDMWSLKKKLVCPKMSHFEFMQF